MSTDSASLFSMHRNALVAYAAKIVGSRPEAEDLVQEAWMRFDESTRGRYLAQPLSYLYRIVRNLALDTRRRTARKSRVLVGIELDAAAEESHDKPVTPESQAIHREQLRLLNDALNELPDRTRIAFDMHRLGGCKLREIAGFLGISVPYAQALVAAGMDHCRKRLGWP
ncbi:sigma-70 family RNA polymerase sigma factor [Reyranella sp.]|uniref:sigma-70 family RNA polymerase sigma factor n=1 Tax=Reyranella sp. TaxID=1929291 RepID=UPI0025DA0CB7|nr:sigma-70 family RNA polymerase sigma factor [Reyranella sp.]